MALLRSLLLAAVLMQCASFRVSTTFRSSGDQHFLAAVGATRNATITAVLGPHSPEARPYFLAHNASQDGFRIIATRHEILRTDVEPGFCQSIAPFNTSDVALIVLNATTLTGTFTPSWEGYYRIVVCERWTAERPSVGPVSVMIAMYDGGHVAVGERPLLTVLLLLAGAHLLLFAAWAVACRRETKVHRTHVVMGAAVAFKCSELALHAAALSAFNVTGDATPLSVHEVLSACVSVLEYTAFVLILATWFGQSHRPVAAIVSIQVAAQLYTSLAGDMYQPWVSHFFDAGRLVVVAFPVLEATQLYANGGKKVQHQVWNVFFIFCWLVVCGSVRCSCINKLPFFLKLCETPPHTASGVVRGPGGVGVHCFRGEAATSAEPAI